MAFPDSSPLYEVARVFVCVAAGLCLLSCTADPPGPRTLTEEELALIEVDGGVSKWLPIRFAADVRNGNEELDLVELEIEVAGYVRRRSVHIGAGESRRVRLQYIFPDDAGWDEPLDPDAPWRLLGARGVAATD